MVVMGLSSVHKVSACLLLLTCSPGTGASPRDRFRRQNFQNFPAIPQQTRPVTDFNSARYQTQFSPEQSRGPQQRQQLSLPGSGKSLFDQIVKRINSGHRENARRKQSEDQNIRQESTQQIQDPRSFSQSAFPPRQPPQPPRPVPVSQPQTTETTPRPNLGLLLFGSNRNLLSGEESSGADQQQDFQQEQRLRELELERQRQLIQSELEERRLKDLELKKLQQEEEERQRAIEQRKAQLEERRRKLAKEKQEEQLRLKEIIRQEQIKKEEVEAELLRKQQREEEERQAEILRKQQREEEERQAELLRKKQREEEERQAELLRKKQREEEERIRIQEKKRLEEKRRMENEIRELLKEQKLRETQFDERRRLEDLRLMEIQKALKQRENEAANIEREFLEAERTFEKAKEKRIISLKKLDEERLKDLAEIETIESSRKAAEERQQAEVLGAVGVLNGFLSGQTEDSRPPEHIIRALKDLSDFLASDRQ